MEMLYIFWIGMYLLIEILVFIHIEHTLIGRLWELSFDDSLGWWLTIIMRATLLIVFAPFVAVYSCYLWIKAK